MGATWFDRLRGEQQGRIAPTGATPPHGDRAFVLGADAAVTEPAIVSAGDYTEVRQVVDLTAYDLLTATLDTIGRVVQPYVGRCGWRTGAEAELARWDLDQAPDAVPNAVAGGPPLVGALAAGELELDHEGYSADAALCRRVPAGATVGRLIGQNTPGIAPGTLSAYTLQAWIDFATGAHAGSTGISPVVFSVIPPFGPAGAGLRLSLQGAAGPGVHQWRPYLEHKVNGVGTATALFPAPVIDAPPGWGMLSIRYDASRPPGLQAEACWDGAAVAAQPIAWAPGAPDLGLPIFHGDPLLVGGLSAVRLVGRRLDDAELLASWNECLAPPAPIALAWHMEILIDGVPFARRTIPPTERRRWTDWAVPVRRYTGAHDVAFRLALGPA